MEIETLMTPGLEVGEGGCRGGGGWGGNMEGAQSVLPSVDAEP